MSATFNELEQQLLRNKDDEQAPWEIQIPENWMQGRTTYGGLSSALCLLATQKQFTDLPPLRSAQINFVGPAGGAINIHNEVLRRGKSVAFIESRMHGEQGIATQANFCFGVERQSKLDQSFGPAPSCPDIGDCEPLIDSKAAPLFTQNFESLLAKGGRPASSSDQHEHYIWIRFKEAVAVSDASLLAIADMPPPAVLPMFDSFAPISSMTWMVNFLQENPKTKDGWWLMRTAAEHARQGYSSQDMQLWNSDRELVLTSRQNVAIFY